VEAVLKDFEQHAAEGDEDDVRCSPISVIFSGADEYDRLQPRASTWVEIANILSS